MKGPFDQGDRAWMVRATNSLPVPLGPVMRTVLLLRLTASMIR